jgi:membrane-bound metal-dependent hydrolase YbcI (DUF457 family)
MAPGHALSGVAVWLGGWAVAQQHLGADPQPDTLIFGAIVTAGGALLPDLDHPNSRVSKCAGPISWTLNKLLAGIGEIAYTVTRRPADKRRDGGHRTISHTLLFAVLISWLATWCGQRWGSWTALVLVAGLGALGLEAALDALPVTRKLEVPLLPALAGAALLLVDGSAWWLGLAVGVGCFVHCLGDCVTESSCPWLWPLPLPAGTDRHGEVRWQVWRCIGPPKWLRFRVNGPVERWLVIPLLTAAGGYATYSLIMFAP